jgi:hypothetical protein
VVAHEGVPAHDAARSSSRHLETHALGDGQKRGAEYACPCRRVVTVADVEQRAPAYNDVVKAMNQLGWAASDIRVRRRFCRPRSRRCSPRPSPDRSRALSGSVETSTGPAVFDGRAGLSVAQNPVQKLLRRLVGPPLGRGQLGLSPHQLARKRFRAWPGAACRHGRRSTTSTPSRSGLRPPRPATRRRTSRRKSPLASRSPRNPKTSRS